jgi:hypothetical protein
VCGADGVVGAAVERGGEALLGLAELLAGRLDRRLTLRDLLECGVHSRSDLGDAGHSGSLLQCRHVGKDPE